MRTHNLKATIKAAAQVLGLVLFGAVASFAQTVSLTAGPATAPLPDGSAVPMWGYSCTAQSGATCTALNPAATTSAIWSPVVITVPYNPAGTNLTITLTNNLTFAPTGGGAANTVPTSLTIVGQVGGGLGTTGASCFDAGGVAHGVTCTASPTHPSQVVTWSTVGTSTAFTPPSQGPRVQSFATEVVVGTPQNLVWNTRRPGTYLIESGTHPSIQGPMGLYGVLVVTCPVGGAACGAVPAGTAYPAVPAVTNASPAVPAITYSAEIPMVFGEIDPVQNNSVNAAVTTAGFSETMVWSGLPNGCGNPSSSTYHQCYPPAVNYTPLYYMINGVAFNRTNAAGSVFPTLPAAVTTGNVLVRMVNAGLHMHVPSIVGSLTAGQTPVGVATPVGGFALIAEDGNVLPGIESTSNGAFLRIQTDVFMAAGKVYDVMINAPATATALPIYDRELSLSGGAINRDAGMLAYIGVNGGAAPLAGSLGAAVANADMYTSIVPCTVAPCVPVVVSDPSKGVIANDVNIFGVKLNAAVAVVGGTVALNENGTFTFTPSVGSGSGSFGYCGNGATTGATCTSVTLNGVTPELPAGITAQNRSYLANTATFLAIKTPGVLGPAGDTLANPPVKDAQGFPLTLSVTSIANTDGMTVLPDVNGGFTASIPAACTVATGCVHTFTYKAQNSQGTLSAAATVTVTFPQASGLTVKVLDGYDKTTVIQDYRWIIEEDRTFFIDPNNLLNNPNNGKNIVPTLGVNFHTSYMPYVAQGCTGPLSCEAGQTAVQPDGSHKNVVCDVGNGACRLDTTGNGFTVVMPSSVHLDPTKRYYISVLPGDAITPFQTIIGGVATGYAGSPASCSSTPATTTPGTSNTCGHGMGGTSIGAGVLNVTVLTQPSPYPPAKLSVFVFEDDFPLNGEHDSSGGTGAVNTNNEPGLGGFQIHLWDAFGGNGDFTGQMTYDQFNQPLTNGLAGQADPSTGNDACPITSNPRNDGNGNTDPTANGITGMIVTCPEYESDGVTPSPLAGQAVVENLMAGRWGIIATPGADRIARGEEWHQTNTLDGQKAHDSFTRIGEPSYFQEFGPAGYHVSIGFANPMIINSRHAGVCAGTDPNFPSTKKIPCNNTITGRVVGERLSRTPDERLYGSGSHDAYYWTQCLVSFGDPDAEDFAFTKCDDQGNFKLTGLPDGDWRITTFDQWNDQLVDGLSTPVSLSAGNNPKTTAMGDIAATQWQTNLYTKTYINDDKSGLPADPNGPGIPFANVAVRLRDGSIENLQLTDFSGVANFNESFPLFSWYTVETDVTRYKNTGTHVVYDAGGPADGTLNTCGGPSTVSGTGFPPCGTSTIGKFLANTVEQVSVPTNLRVPGAVYCATADCTGKSIQTPVSDPPSVCTTNTTGTTACSTKLSTGRIDPPWVGIEGWQGFPGQNNFLQFGKAPYFEGENGGIHGHVIYASTRPFDDPQLLVQTQWEPLVPNVTINLYQEGFAADGITPTRKLVDTTKTSSFDDWAQGFHLGPDGVTQIPNMSCPGQGNGTAGTAIPDLFFFSLMNQPDYLDVYNAMHNGGTLHQLPNSSQFKCYDGMHNWNQIQPVPYDGAYQFPSVTATNPTTGRPTATNCTICVPDPVPTTGPDADLLHAGLPMLPPGKYVVEVVLPPGFELVKEEDKNILVGDNYIAPVTQQIGGLGNVFIVPDQASVAAAAGYPGPGFNANNAQNSTTSLGTTPSNNIVPGFVPEPTWPCVGEARVVPDYISLYPQTHQVAPFAGTTRNLCDRKEVTLSDQMGAIAKFYMYTSTHIAAKFTGGITDDYTSEFDPFSPQFGEKFAPPDLPVSIKDWAGNETSRVYADHWGSYDGMTYSTWEVNAPNPTGYAPTVMVVCMNDPGPVPGPGGTMITDPLFTQGYSQFCYELPFMPGTTQYLDTPVVPTSAFAGAGYNNVDCAYPDATPAIAEVDTSAGVGPWLPMSGGTVTITSLAGRSTSTTNPGGNTLVPNYAYSGPAATAAPYNTKTIARHYGFGSTAGSVAIGNLKFTTGAHSSTNPGGISTWTDSTIVLTVGKVPNGLTTCALQQQSIYGGSTAMCGELVVTAANGKQSVDSVTITQGGKSPTHVAASDSIQGAIDAAAPGDLIIVDPTCTSSVGATEPCTTAGATQTTGAHNEMVLMWKPVRLQGVGAATSIINANTHPAGKLDTWRQYVNCLFGLSLSGTPLSSKPIGTDPNPNTYDPTGQFSCPGNGWAYFNNYDESATSSSFSSDPAHPGAAGTVANNAQVDRLPLEAVIGWNAELNGNLAELLQEPSLMGALEGATITVLSKGVDFRSDQYDATLLMGFPTDTTLLQGTFGSECTTRVAEVVNGKPVLDNRGRPVFTTINKFPSNFWCNPSSIDGLGLTDSSQGGGAIFVHGWGHNLQIANNKIYNNAGTLSGGINVGQGEYPPAYIQGSATNAAPGSCLFDFTLPAGTVLPYCHDVNVNVHNNYIALNSSTGDELFSATPAGAGGVSFCTGSDYYQFNYNWVCGNLSSGDGGGLGHLGFSWNGDIEHNTIIFNQSLNPTIPANGGGLVVMGTPDADVVCPGPGAAGAIDQDCAIPGNQLLAQGVGPSDGAGPNLLINANLIQGNSAEAGDGGGIAFQQVNGSDVVAFPTSPENWNTVTVTNNIITDNVAGWDGAGISLYDSLAVDVINNTIANNASTASAGILFTTLGSPLASQPPPSGNAGPGGTGPGQPNCTNGGETASCPQVAGVVAIRHSAVLIANLPFFVTCPAGHPNCRRVSFPKLENDIIYNNSSYFISVTSGLPNTQFQQHVVTLNNAIANSPVANQPAGDVLSATANGGHMITGGTGACLSVNNYWDIGVRGDTGPSNHNSGFTLSPTYSVLTSLTGYTTQSGQSLHNFTGDPAFISSYCDGSRTPPEAPGLQNSGWAVPPGISDATVPNPIFNLNPVATVDEGNNWINLRWGPLSLTNPTVTGTDGNFGGGAMLGNYGLANSSPSSAGNKIACTSTSPSGNNGADAPAFDFYGAPRKTSSCTMDIGAVEAGSASETNAEILSLDPPDAPYGAGNINVNLSGSGFTGTTAVTFAGTAPTPNMRVNNFTIVNDSSINANISLPGTAAVTGVAAGLTTPAPATGTTKNGTLTVTNNATGVPGTYSVTVTDSTNGNSLPITFTVTAAGTNGSITLTAAPTVTRLTGAGAFSIQPGGNCVAGHVIAPGANCTINIRYVPNGGSFTSTGRVTIRGTGLPGFGGTGTANFNIVGN